MKMVFKKEKSDKITTTIAIPVTNEMSEKVHELKSKIDVNAMTREFLKTLIKEAEKSDGRSAC